MEISYLEIYNEKIKDLLNPEAAKKKLQVRESPKIGVYVQGLSRMMVGSYEDVQRFLDLGGKARTVAATQVWDCWRVAVRASRSRFGPARDR